MTVANVGAGCGGRGIAATYFMCVDGRRAAYGEIVWS
jgi:hypothetical protein